MAQSDDDLEIEVLALSGSTVATVKLPRDAFVADLKERIADASGIPVSIQSLAFPSRELDNDRERLSTLSPSGEEEISVILILKESTPIDFNIDGKPHQITSARVKLEDKTYDLHLDESPNSVLRRLQLLESGAPGECGKLLETSLANSNIDQHHLILVWDGIPVDGGEAIRQRLVEIIESEDRTPITPGLDGSVVCLDLKPNPSKLPESSILFGLPSGKFFGTHQVGRPPCGTWGWIRLGESDGICGMRVMSYPTCGNTEPSGAFLIEYVGTVTARTQIHAGTAMYNTTRLLALRNRPAQDQLPDLDCEVLHLSHGRMAVHQHAPLEALEVSAVPDCTLIAVKSEGVEMIMVPLIQAPEQHGARALVALPSVFDTVLPPGQLFLPVSTCAHLNRVPERYNPTWLQRKLRQLMFGC